MGNTPEFQWYVTLANDVGGDEMTEGYSRQKDWTPVATIQNFTVLLGCALLSDIPFNSCPFLPIIRLTFDNRNVQTDALYITLIKH